MISRPTVSSEINLEYNETTVLKNYAITGRQKKHCFKTKNPAKAGLKINPGSYLLFHTVAHAVPLAYRSLTSLFGKGRGVSS